MNDKVRNTAVSRAAFWNKWEILNALLFVFEMKSFATCSIFFLEQMLSTSYTKAYIYDFVHMLRLLCQQPGWGEKWTFSAGLTSEGVYLDSESGQQCDRNTAFVNEMQWQDTTQDLNRVLL